jgi:hypothetical protein
MTLNDLGSVINFSYYPVPHLSDTGDIICQVEDQGEVFKFDCEGREFEQCLVAANCATSGDCSHDVQQKLASFLECFEGPYANTEGYANTSLRVPCMDKAELEIQPVEDCLNDTAKVTALSAQMKALKEVMTPKLGPNPGTYPHIFIDGKHQSNYSWVALTRILCDSLGVSQPACQPTGMSLSFDVAPAVLKRLANVANLSAPIASAVDTATSAAALPIGFDEADPKYVNVRAVTSVGAARLGAAGVSLESLTVLAAFGEHALHGVVQARFTEALSEELKQMSVEAEASDFGNVSISYNNNNVDLAI